MDRTPQDISHGAVKKNSKWTDKMQEEYEYLNQLEAERERKERRKKFLAECAFPRPSRFASPKKTPSIAEQSRDENEDVEGGLYNRMPSIFGEFDFAANIKYSNAFIDTMKSFEVKDIKPLQDDSSVTSRVNLKSEQLKYKCKKPAPYSRDFSGATYAKKKSPDLPVIWEVSHESLYTDDHDTKKRCSKLPQKPQVKKS